MNGSRSLLAARLTLVYLPNRYRPPKTCNFYPIFQQIGKYARTENSCSLSFTATHTIICTERAPVKTAPAPVSVTGATSSASAICGVLQIKRKRSDHHL